MGRSKAPSLPIKALSFCRPTELRGKGGGASHQRGETPEWYMKCMTPCFSFHTSRFPLRGTPRRGKGCTRQSADLTPDRQSAACVIFASYPWTHLRCEGSKGSKGGGLPSRCTANTFRRSASDAQNVVSRFPFRGNEYYNAAFRRSRPHRVS